MGRFRNPLAHMNTPLRIGFVGVGGMGQAAHLRNFIITPGCQVVALAEVKPRLGQLVAQRFGVPAVYTDFRQMLAKENLDAVVAIQQFQAHGKILPEILAGGVTVLSEKPIGRSVESAQQVLAAATQSGKNKLFVGYHKRSDPATLAAVAQIDAWKKSGVVGKLRYVRITMPPGNWSAAGFSHFLNTDEKVPPLDTDPAPANLDKSAAQKHEWFVNYYIHQVNLMRHLLGENYQAKFVDPTGVLMVAQSDSGVAATLEMAPYHTTRDWQEIAFICFEKGWIKLELPAPLVIDQPGRVTIFEDPGNGATPKTASPTLPPIHAMRQQAIHFVAAVRGEKNCLCEAAEAAEDMNVAQQFIELLTQAEQNRSSQS